MNINSNNMKWLSGYSLMNKLFSQKNRNNAGVSKQAGVNVSGGVKYKHSNLYYDENGVPWIMPHHIEGIHVPEKNEGLDGSYSCNLTRQCVVGHRIQLIFCIPEI